MAENYKPLSDFMNWEKSDLEQFLNSSRSEEGFEIEFKGADPFKKPKLTETEKTDHLSRTISAFANTSAGFLFLGVEDDETKSPRHFVLDGIPNPPYDRGRIIDILHSCTNPNYFDLKVKEIHWSGNVSVYVCHIPEFRSTPIQCKDLRYYIRAEKKSVPIEGDRVRSLFFKAGHPDIHIEILPKLTGKDKDGTCLIYSLALKLGNKSHVRARDVKIELDFKNISEAYIENDQFIERQYPIGLKRIIFPNTYYPTAVQNNSKVAILDRLTS
jgi:predicted HTH transcriptional regulator